MLQTLSPRQHNPFELAGTFAGLMDLYERNYIGLRHLVPDLRDFHRSSMAATVAYPLHFLSTRPNALPLHLSIAEQHRFTSDIVLTYQFVQQFAQGQPSDYLREPNLHIRIYHDARQADVLAAQSRRWPRFDVRHQTNLSANACHSALLARWRANRFLFKWLTYTLHQGHRFELGVKHFDQ